MPFSVTILGSNSAIPSHGRHPTSQVLNVHDRLFLIDCGEGTQIRLEKYRVRHSRIENIFISHLHGDHFFGLIGLITSYHLNHREKPLTIYCPKGLDEIIKLQLKYSDTRLRYELNFVQLNPVSGETIFESEFMNVKTIKLTHRIPCTGFLFREKIPTEKNIRPEKIAEFDLTISQIQDAKRGKDLILPDGTVIKNSDLTLTPHPPRSYAYCTDTAYETSIIPNIKGVDLLYHEATFDQSHEARAKETFHSTTLQAAEIAKSAMVKKLLIGHFSARYKNLDGLLKEAQTIFPETQLAIEGSTFEIERSVMNALAI